MVPVSLNKLIKNTLRKEELIITPVYQDWLNRNRELIVPEHIGMWVMKELARTPRDRSGSFSASGMGRCLREQVFSYLGVEERKRVETDKVMIFHDGHFRHLKWQALLRQAGLLVEAEIPIWLPKWRMKGTLDGIGEQENWGTYGIELKGANDRSYKYVLENGPKMEHLLQIHAYMIGHELDLFSLIYENKNTQEWKEFVVRWDDELGDEVTTQAQYLNSRVDEGVLPPVLDKCLDKKGKYRNCSFSHMCLKVEGWEDIARYFEADDDEPKIRILR